MGFSRTSIALLRAALIVALLVIGYLAFADRHFQVLEQFWDKLRHAAAFCALALLVDFAFPASRFGPAKILVLLAYGAGIEVVQYFLPYREASGWDLVADSVGIAAYAISIPALKHLYWLRLRWQANAES